MQYSPKLKKMMEQIKSILKENDIAGVVVLHTPGFSEYLNHLETSYSCATSDQNGIRFRLKTSEVGKDRAREIAEGTFNMMTHFSDIVSRNAIFYMDAQKLLKDKWNGFVDRGGHSSHTEQNN